MKMGSSKWVERVKEATSLLLLSVGLALCSVDSVQAVPAIPQTLEPANGALNVPKNPTLEISCNDPQVEAAQFVIATDSSFSTLVYDSMETVNDLCSHVSLAQLNPLSQYHWRARVRDDQGVWSNWSSGSVFTTNNITTLFYNVFQDGVVSYNGTRDADIRGSGVNPTQAIRDWNQGKQDVLRTGRRPPQRITDEIYRSLLKFDLSALTNSTAVLTAYLEMTGWQHGPANDNVVFNGSNSLYQVVKPWGEGQGVVNQQPKAGEVSWTYSEHPVQWGIAGAANASDSDPSADRKATPLAKVVVTNQVGYRTLWSSREFVETVKEWIANPNTNQGLFFKADDEGVRNTFHIASREHSDPVFRPRLVIVSTQEAFPTQNQPPLAVRDTASTFLNAQVSISVLNNDIDPDNAPAALTITDVGSPENGTANIVGDEIVYLPNTGFSGLETFWYTITDGNASASAMISIHVQNVIGNLAPLANNDSYNVSLNTELTIGWPGVLDNDTDPNGDPLTAVLDTSPVNGTVVLNADGSFTYTPNAGFSGTDSFTYHAYDGELDSSSVMVILDVEVAPLAVDDSATTVEGVPVPIPVLTNDTDGGGLDTSSVQVLNGPSQGTTSVDAVTGDITYTPTAGYVGQDSFTYTVEDTQGLSSNVATVTVTVNEAPLRVQTGLVVYYPLNEGSGTTVQDQSNVGVPMNLTLSGTVDWATGSNGLVFASGQAQSSGAASKVITALQATNQSTMEMWIEPGNMTQGGPARVVSLGKDPTYQTYMVGQEGENMHARMLHTGKNDGRGRPWLQPTDNALSVGLMHIVHTYDGATERLYVNGVENPTTIDRSGVFSNWNVTHKLTLGNEGSGNRPWNGTMWMMAMYDRPLTFAEIQQNFGAGPSGAGGSGNQSPAATDDSYPGHQDTLLSISAPGVLSNDSDPNGDPLTAVLDTNAANGTVVLNSDGSFTYTPIAGFNGTDSFTYHAHDGTVGSTVATVTLTINGAPVATDDSTTTLEDTPVTIAVLTNDTDDGALNAASVMVQTGPGQGSTSVDLVTGEITYTPNIGYIGTDSFTYTVEDTQGLGSNVATVTVQVTDGNLPPVAIAEGYSGHQDTELNIPAPGVLSNDSDPNGDPLTAVVDTNAANGTVVLNADGSFTYTPTAGFNGTDSFTYHAHDGALNSPSVTVTLTINGAPVAADDSATTLEVIPITIAVLTNDTDDGALNAASVTVQSGPSNGSTSVNLVTGEITYTPNAGFIGTDSFTYTVQDTQGLGSNVATVTVEVLDDNVPPVATGEGYSGHQGIPLSIPAPGVLSNDSDPNGDPLTAVLDTNAANGTMVLNTDGSFTYTPNAGFNGIDSFTYHAHDGALNSPSVTVTLTINGAPVAADDSATTIEETAVTIAVLTNDTDDGVLNASTVAVQSGPSNGSTSVDPVTGEITYTPNAGYIGTDSFTYTVQDTQGLGSNVATVTVEVTEPPLRVQNGLVVYYPLNEGGGTTVQDQSNVGAPMNLTMSGTVDWATGSNGLVFTGGQAQSSGAASKVITALQATNQSTMEMWIEPGNLTQGGPARVVSLGKDPKWQNYMLGQEGANMHARLTHSGKGHRGRPWLKPTDNALTTGLMHIVHTFDGTTERLYVNGVEHPTTIVRSGGFSNWNLTHPLTLGNEGTGNRPWTGTMRMMAIYDRALTLGEIQQNFGVGATNQ